MYPKTAFCEECREGHAYHLEPVSLQAILKGKMYSYNGKRAICSRCGTEVCVPTVEDDNLKSLYDVYRDINGIITHEQVVAIPEKYEIGKRPLSLLLGWGEMTFSRYYDGDMPSKQYSDVLQRIHEDPEYYLTVLEENRHSLPSQLAYEKSKRRVMALLGAPESSRCKINQVIDYLLVKCEDVTPLALQKALYYVQGFYSAFDDAFLFADDCEAWVHGPVYREIYNRYSTYRFDPINSKEEFDPSVFTEVEKAIIDSIIRYFCCYSGKTLERFTHSETPWLATRGDLPADAPSNRIINKQVLAKYFSAVKEKYNMLTPDDIGDRKSVV